MTLFWKKTDIQYCDIIGIRIDLKDTIAIGPIWRAAVMALLTHLEQFLLPKSGPMGVMDLPTGLNFTTRLAQEGINGAVGCPLH